VNSTYTPSSLRTKRIGKLIHLRYAIPPRVSPKTQPTRCWVATVEFDKLHNSGNPETTTIRYRVPAKFIKNVPRSQAPKRPPLSINDQVRVRATPKTKGNRAGRTGYITCIYLSAYTKRRRIARPKAQWLIRVRFPKLRGWKKSRTGFIEYCFTPDLLKAIKTSTQKQQSIKA
jgi:hypothetical protein